MWRAIHIVVAASVVVLLSANAAPQNAPTDRRFNSAIEMFESGRAREALPTFKALYQKTKSPNARLYIARCLVALGRLPEAYREMSGTLQDAAALAEREERYAETRDAAATELPSIEAQVAIITVLPPTGATNLEVKLNGEALPETDLGKPTPVAPGKVTLTGSGSGGTIVAQRFDMRAGEKRVVAIAFETEPTPPEKDDPEPPASTGPDLTIPGAVTLSIGLAGLTLFTIAQVVAQSEYTSLRDECGNTRCSNPDAAEKIDRGKALETASWIGLGIGSAALITGIALLAVNPAETTPVTAWLSPTSAGLAWRGSLP